MIPDKRRGTLFAVSQNEKKVKAHVSDGRKEGCKALPTKSHSHKETAFSSITHEREIFQDKYRTSTVQTSNFYRTNTGFFLWLSRK